MDHKDEITIIIKVRHKYMYQQNSSYYSDPVLNEITKNEYKNHADQDKYDLSVTLTFPYKVTEELAQYYFKLFFRKLQKKAFGKNTLKKIRNYNQKETALQVGIEYKGNFHFHFRIRKPNNMYFKEGFLLQKEIKTIWCDMTGSQQIDIQRHYTKINGYNFYDYFTKDMSVSYEGLEEYFWND